MSSHVPAAGSNRLQGQTPATFSIPPVISKGLTLSAIAVLLGFIAVEGSKLFREWGQLNRQLSHTRRELIVGYTGINPNFTEAHFPADWIHDEGVHTLLWAGWDGRAHQWFQIGLGELGRDQISTPLGRDSIRAIDIPLIEISGGPHWERIPDEAPIIGLQVSGQPLAYPMRVLEKVEVVNDEVQGVPFVLTFSPFAELAEAVVLYDSLHEGKRLSLGSSGYFLARKPVLYDRDTQSLWVRTDHGLTAIAGKRKGSNLKELSRHLPIAWGTWRSQNPNSRLVVGADRTKKPDFVPTALR